MITMDVGGNGETYLTQLGQQLPGIGAAAAQQLAVTAAEKLKQLAPGSKFKGVIFADNGEVQVDSEMNKGAFPWKSWHPHRCATHHPYQNAVDAMADYMMEETERVAAEMDP